MTMTNEEREELISIRASLLSEIGTSFSVVEENKRAGVQIGKQNLILITKGRFKGIVYSYRDSVNFRETENGGIAVDVHPELISHSYSEAEIKLIDADPQEWRDEFLVFVRKVAILLTLCQLIGDNKEKADDTDAITEGQ